MKYMIIRRNEFFLKSADAQIFPPICNRHPWKRMGSEDSFHTNSRSLFCVWGTIFRTKLLKEHQFLQNFFCQNVITHSAQAFAKKNSFKFAVVFLSLFQLDPRYKCWGQRLRSDKQLNSIDHLHDLKFKFCNLNFWLKFATAWWAFLTKCIKWFLGRRIFRKVAPK